MSFWERSSSPQRTSTQLKPRRHKGLVFQPYPEIFKNRRTVNKALKELRDQGRKKGKLKISDHRYYRVYKHKYQSREGRGSGFIIYISSKEKTGYGGVRRRSPTGKGSHSKYRKDSNPWVVKK